MSVVDEDGHGLALATPGDCPGDLTQDLQQVGAWSEVWHQGREGPEGNAGRPLGGGDPERDIALGSGYSQALSG